MRVQESKWTAPGASVRLDAAVGICVCFER
jgi:hypothetical protein